MEALLLHENAISACNRSGKGAVHVNGFFHSGGPYSHDSTLFNIHGSLFGLPPSLSSSSFSSFNLPLRHQPPLLPLPPAKAATFPSLPRPPVNRKAISRAFKDQSFALKQAKVSSPNHLRRVQTATVARPRRGQSCDLSKEVGEVIKASGVKISSLGRFEEFSGSIFSVSPPPSSLPLPKFSVRPKGSCNAEAVGVDASATDDLRRLLRLQ